MTCSIVNGDCAGAEAQVTANANIKESKRKLVWRKRLGKVIVG
ncbi:MAG: hypothetical protein WA824_09975 [Candidatus Sulfotelmatobacter sp.]